MASLMVMLMMHMETRPVLPLNGKILKEVTYRNKNGLEDRLTFATGETPAMSTMRKNA